MPIKVDGFIWLVLLIVVLLLYFLINWLIKYVKNIKPKNTLGPVKTIPTPPFQAPVRDYFKELERATKLARGKKKAEAYRIFKSLESQYGNQDVDLLLWIAYTTPYGAEAERAISQAEGIDPNNQGVKQARDWLKI